VARNGAKDESLFQEGERDLERDPVSVAIPVRQGALKPVDLFTL